MNLKMPDSTYIAGTCNIGEKEIRRRQSVAIIGLFLSISTLLVMILVSAPRGARFGIFIPLMITAVGYVQARSKFCLAYGFAGTFNFGKLGDLSRVSDSESKAADRATALSILGKSFVLAIIATAVVLVLPL
jgi:predicted nucleic acid-binding Zn ribbon protein